MAFAEANRVRLRYIPEAVWGEVPGSGVVRELRILSSSMSAEKETTTSEELRADRMVSSVPEVAARAGGELEFEMSAFSHDDFWQQAVLSSWSLDMNGFLLKGALVTVTGASQITLTGADYTDWLANNQWIKLEGFMTLANNGYFSINGTPAFTAGNTVITVDQSTLVAEVGSAYTKIIDAGDVIQVSTLTTFVATNKINGGGANAFAGLTLDVGQRIYVEGLGKETATITIGGGDAIDDGDTITLSDGEDSKRFEFNTSATAVGSGNVYVDKSTNPATARTNLITAINDQSRKQNLRMTAAVGAAGSKQAGSFAFATTAETGDQLTVDDGQLSVQFTFVASGATLSTEVNKGASATDSAANLATVINAYPLLNVTATPTTGTCAIVNDNYTGGALTEQTDGGTDITTTDFGAGTAPTLVVTNHRGTGGVITESVTAITVGAFSGGSATKSGVYTIASLPDDDSIVVVETLSTDTNVGTAKVVIKGSHLRNRASSSAIVKQSMVIETAFEDVSQFFVMDGQRISEFELSVESGSIVTGTWTMMGRGAAPYDATQLGDTADYTVLESTNTEVLNATANVGAIMRDGAVLSTAVKSIEIQGNNNCRYQDAVGSKFPRGVAYGRFQLSGSLEAYFENLDFWSSFIDHVSLSLSFDFEDVDHNKVYFSIPQLKITENPVNPEGIDTDVMESMEWEALRDPVLNTMFLMDRFSSIYPFTG